MAGRTGIPTGEEGERLAMEENRRTQDRLAELTTECAKSIAVLNSGGIVAMLGFSQALVGKAQFANFKPYAITAAAFFLAGAVLGAITFAIRWQEELHYQRKTSHRKFWSWAVTVAIGLAFAAFVFGGVVIGFGIARHL